MLENSQPPILDLFFDDAKEYCFWFDIQTSNEISGANFKQYLDFEFLLQALNLSSALNSDKIATFMNDGKDKQGF